MKLKHKRIIAVIILSAILWYIIISKKSSKQSIMPKDQIKSIAKEINDRKIRQINEDQIYQKTLFIGQKIIRKISENGIIDSLEQQYNCKIQYAQEPLLLTGIEKMIFEAYQESNQESENVQKDGKKTLIFSKSTFEEEKLDGVWIIKFMKKNIIQQIYTSE